MTIGPMRGLRSIDIWVDILFGWDKLISPNKDHSGVFLHNFHELRLQSRSRHRLNLLGLSIDYTSESH